ncbi:hypothetical protein CDD83_5288 [Cordyceps sp. RAO-2017]|nr:hypothetical protein CDD83_5288 [Cordyceps sp. RAO-2017]
MSSTQELLQEFSGELVPFSFHAGFVCLSYIISLIGTGSTLELMRRRTSHKGLHNLLLLIGAAASMGGIAIWSMHFIGNRAIYILDGREDLQISYSTGMTVLSLLVPILVLLLAFLAVSVNDRIRWWRIGLAGLLSGGAICGMHYLADRSISNYQTSYERGYVVGAAMIAISASTTALTLFFVFETAWNIVWWKRFGCAMVLAGAVSGMHWCAAVGTSYRLLQITSLHKGMSRHETLIMVICLSIAACIVMVISSFYSSWVKRDYASKSQQVVLAAAIFDEKGRIMVNQEGFLPSEVVTDTFMTKSHDDVFDTAHHLFHWMYRASRNWISIAESTDKMARHIRYLSQNKHSGRTGLKLVREDGSLVRDYDQIVCELFCLAALALATKTKESLIHAGTLWDEIFATGNNPNRSNLTHTTEDANDASSERTRRHKKLAKDKSIFDGLAEKGLVRAHPQDGRGCLMFLVRHANVRKDIHKLEAAGYRFAEIHHVVDSIRSSMQIRSPDFISRLRGMSNLCGKNIAPASGVHLGMFAVRARLDHCGFDVLVRKDAKNLLPMAALPLQRLEPWQLKFIQHFWGLNPSAIMKRLDEDGNLSIQEARLASHLRAAILSLRRDLSAAHFDDATLVSQVVQAPCSVDGDNSSPLSTCSLAVFRIMLPIHINGDQLTDFEFVPLSFFKVQQMVYAGSAHHVEFSHQVHRELSSMVHSFPELGLNGPQTRPSLRLPLHAWMARFRCSARTGNDVALQSSTRSQERLSGASSSRSWPRPLSDEISLDDYYKSHSASMSSHVNVSSPLSSTSSAEDAPHRQRQQLFGGIMVSQQITVDVQEIERSIPLSDQRRGKTQPNTKYYTSHDEKSNAVKQNNYFSTIASGKANAAITKEQGGSDFIDELLSFCMERRDT